MDLRRCVLQLAVVLAAAAVPAACRLEPSPAADGPPRGEPQGGVALLGLRTAIYHVRDLQTARDWYAELLGAQPSFEEPFYVGFTVAGYELGLDPDTSLNAPGPGGTVAYWGVANADSAVARALAAGATEHEPVQAVGGGVRIGSVRDPFGNVIGFVENPTFSGTTR